MKIWKTNDLLNISQFQNQTFPIYSSEEYMEFSPSSDLVAIIGGGPKGLYGLESLISAAIKQPNDIPIEIHWFNTRADFGSGDIYNVDQPEYLLINYAIGNINAWKEDKTEDFDGDKLDFTGWIRKNVSDPESVQKSDFASRALTGYYLHDVALQLLYSLPKNIKVKCVIGTVSDIIPAGEKHNLQLGGFACNPGLYYNHVLIATGHSENHEENDSLQLFSHLSQNAVYISKVYPVDTQLQKISNLHKVGIKGMGLTFIDALLALTEGRDGQFVPLGKQYTYIPSGSEPLSIYPFSRSGMPMIPRCPALEEFKSPPRYLNQCTVDILLRTKGRGNIDFESDVLPALEKELKYVYYSGWIKREGYYIDISEEESFEEFMEIVDALLVGHPHIPEFSLEKFLDPTVGLGFISESQYHQFVVDYLKNALNELEAGDAKSPLLSMSTVWGRVLPFVSQLYRFGGFTPESQEKFDQLYLGKLNRVSFGPPAIQIKKMLALVDAGILFFRFGRETEVETRLLTGKYRLFSYQTKYCKEVEALIDARIPKIQTHKCASPLFANLLKREVATIYKNKSYVPGCFAIDTKGSIIQPDGKIKSTISLTGTPTEGITLDNDSLSRNRNDFVTEWGANVVRSYKKKYLKNANQNTNKPSFENT